MKIHGAVIKEQGVTFAIVIVKQYIINSLTESKKTNSAFSSIFGNIPLVLMAQDATGVPTYRGRRDIVNFLSNVLISQIPWREYTI